MQVPWHLNLADKTLRKKLKERLAPIARPYIEVSAYVCLFICVIMWPVMFWIKWETYTKIEKVDDVVNFVNMLICLVWMAVVLVRPQLLSVSVLTFRALICMSRCGLNYWYFRE
jgi:hypothetical protein